MDRLEIDGGTISKGRDKGKPIYLLTVFEAGAVTVQAYYPSYGAALLDGQLAAMDWELPLVDCLGWNKAGGNAHG